MTTARRVLLAEDDRFLRRAFETALRRRGFTVLVAVDGAQALALAKGERPDLVLLDLLMPRLSGFDVLRAMRGDPTTRDVPVLILSNSSRAFDAREAQALGVVACLVKANLSLQDLGDRIERLLAEARP